MFSNLFGGGPKSAPTYDPVKLKPLLKMGITRLRLVQCKRRNEVAKQRRELADLLKAGNVAGCRVRIEGVMREESACGGFEILAMLTDLVASRLPTLTNASAGQCPPEMKESVTSVLWASPFVGTHVPEFVGIKAQMTAKFGEPFVAAAIRNAELSVHEQLRASFDPAAPSELRAVKYMESICAEFGVLIDPELLHSDALLGARAAKDEDDDGSGDGKSGDDAAGFHVQGFWIPFVSVPRDEVEATLLALKRAWA